MTATLRDLTDAAPGYLSALLVGPAGQRINLLNGSGGVTPVSGVDLTFDDAAMTQPPTPLVTGTFQPSAATNITYPAPAPPAPQSAGLATFAGASPNGTWRLYLTSAQNFAGSLDGGWSLTFA